MFGEIVGRESGVCGGINVVSADAFDVEGFARAFELRDEFRRVRECELNVFSTDDVAEDTRTEDSVIGVGHEE